MKLFIYIIPFAIFLMLIVWSANQFDKAIAAFDAAAQQTEQRNGRQ